ncbi:TaqI-like C-terminal specificity domain-containing protein [Spirulina sp. CCNP1310]|uniref:Eco57I restriction-modification methylase domain-containing protein n=1 Tax=Spirulina sp. CCNP1310 TaxID=3110249 RepID=UPI002B20FB93|nr:TaqI-like C-terminal specificity domain-containing protein [Spirulina sp. CCNP1310]MEA5420155.1 TaqI-like C-terminal specificity domain-containing protein [Spirulina sp. CCNP1310]
MSSVNPLFQAKLLNNRVGQYAFPLDLGDRHAIIQRWITTLASGTLDQMKEVSLHGEFLRDIFQGVLGYRSVIEGAGESWEIHAEPTISDGGGSADGAIGLFTAMQTEQGKTKLAGRLVAPIELKGTKADLDKAGSRKESAVDQGWRYANYTAGCKWVIVSNYREIRLYHLDKTPVFAEVFDLVSLGDLEQFKRFFYLLCRANFLPIQPDQDSRIDRLLVESDQQETEVTASLYQEYKQLRIELVNHFKFNGPQDLENREFVLVEKAQKALDRVLFIAFCEDRGLLPRHTIRNAHTHRDPYYPRPIWENFKAVFRWVDQGKLDDPPIPEYNGGLFRFDPILDQVLTVTDPICDQMKNLARFDYAEEVSVDILGRIFEQSVTDLEELQALARGEVYNAKLGKRKKQGVFYTPAYITRYIVGVAVGGYLKRRNVAILGKSELENKADWQTYLDQILRPLKVCDPACGSGAFLIAAFDFLVREYRQVYRNLGEEFEPGLVYRLILQGNLYGVDLSSESVEITKLSLWLQTAQRGQKLADLDRNICRGNSLIEDRGVDPLGFDWVGAFPEVFAAGGFDVVIGNPPYVRQEFIAPFKPFLQGNYQTYDGVADLYTYFYEKGVNLLRAGGVLSYIVTNKWLRAGYGEGLRGFFRDRVVMEEIIDFGHAPIFEDADTFPCIVVGRKVGDDGLFEDQNREVLVCPVPREALAQINLPQYVRESGYGVPWSRFSAQAWSLEPPAVDGLMAKIRAVGVPLTEFAGVKPYRGVLTGFNEAFLIDDETKRNLVKADPKSAEIIKPYLRGQDIKRWSSEWQNLWMIFAHKDIDIDQYSSVKQYLLGYHSQLTNRAGKQLWWQLQASPAFYDYFEQPKIVYQEIQFHSVFCFDDQKYFTNNKCFIIPTSDLYLLGVLNSSIMWWHNWRYFPHMKDDALTPVGVLMESIPIAPPTPEIRAQVEPLVSQLIELTKTNQQSHRDLIDWLRTEHNIDKPGRKLENFSQLSPDEFIQEINKRKPKTQSFGPAARRQAKETYNELAPQILTHHHTITQLEHQLNDLINQAYQLTPQEIALLWQTAPPRMPITPP